MSVYETFHMVSLCRVCSRFPPAATSYILQQFSQYGSIVKRVVSLLFTLPSVEFNMLYGHALVSE